MPARREQSVHRVAACALLLASMVALPARAALFDDDEARKRIEATNQRLNQIQRTLEERMTALENQLKSQGLVELFSQLEQIKADIARLRGQVEVLTYVGLTAARSRACRVGERFAAGCAASRDRGAARLRRGARSVQGGKISGSDRRLLRLREGVSEKPARAICAELARQRAVRAT